MELICRLVSECTCLVNAWVWEGWFSFARGLGGVVGEEVEPLLVPYPYFIGSNVADQVSVSSLNRTKVRHAMRWYRWDWQHLDGCGPVSFDWLCFLLLVLHSIGSTFEVVLIWAAFTLAIFGALVSWLVPIRVVLMVFSSEMFSVLTGSLSFGFSVQEQINWVAGQGWNCFGPTGCDFSLFMQMGQP